MLTQPTASEALLQPIALVSTPHFVLAVDLNCGAVWLVAEGEPEYYGISWFPNADELVLSHTGTDANTLTSIDAIRSSERGWISVGPRALPARLASPHQIVCAPDGRVICTNTGRNAITVLDPAHPGDVEVARISERDWDRLAVGDMSGDHLNSVFLRGRDLYVLAHGHTRGSRLARFEYPTLKLQEVRTIALSTGMHNVWVTDEDQIIVCDSNAGTLTNINSNEVIWRCPSDNFPYLRGLAATSNTIAVGAAATVARSRRSMSETELWLIRREDFTTVAGWRLGNWGVVQEVRFANIVDEAHHGHDFAGLDRLLEGAAEQSPGVPLPICKTANSDECFAWDSFRRLIHAGSFNPHGAFMARQGRVSLFVENEPMQSAERSVELDFDLRDGFDHHCAIVLYGGFGGDSHMDAFVLHRTEKSRSSLFHWVHDGSTWRSPISVRGDLPTRGRYCVRSSGMVVDVLLNGIVVARIPESALSYPLGRLGIRMSGCMVAMPRMSHA